MTTRSNYIQPIEGVASGTAVLISADSMPLPTGGATAANQLAQSNKLDSIHYDLVMLGNYVDGVEGLLATLGNYTDTLESAATSQGNKLDTIHDDLLSIGNSVDSVEGLIQTLGNYVDSLEGYSDGVESLLTNLGNYTDSLEGALPTSRGQHNSTDAICVVPASDATFSVAAPENAFQTVRTWAGATADSEPAVDGSAWVALTGANAAGYVVQLYEITAVGGTVAPTQVVFKTWIRVGGASGTVQKIDEWTADAAWLTTAAATNPYWRRIIPVNCDDIFVTTTFPDGTAPTITGTVKCRAVAHAGLQRRDLTYDPATGLPKFQSASYDSATQTEKVSDSYKECDLYLEEPLVINEASQAVATGTFYYPSAEGIVLGPHNCVSFDYSATAAGGGTVAVSFQATNGSSAWSAPRDVSKSGWGCVAGAAVAGTVTSSADGTISEIVNFSNQSNSCANFARMRMKLVVATANSGAVTVSIRRSVT